ncbi:RluA family pseudouridine synthase [Eoetvoesiella caeni]|uniref:Pseudouridine synthase n=1 Tax=Eoetvoesiella caeni TaxID=645616 RepID=A0A366H7S4_9BURK|nr:RluA family pseudouridine synthase [Eoetvoesiella caeni]MCI2809990.1 RluA family pseudouridine synthase [Eoetvoesiella caeni]NYT55866.1 RluA family pseudouridine synthase [Eoetvoesiella caeni]RBP37523.1 ribosomal large subunit pseudouridine synthase D [Eoetvoesiella caeni]
MPDTDIATESLNPVQPLQFELPFKALPERLDKVLARLIPEHSRSRLQAWIEGGHVHVNGQAARVRQMVNPGDKITVWEQLPPESLAFSPEPVEFGVVAESPDWIVVNKPAGLVTHPGAGNWSGTLLNGLLHRFPELKAVARAGIVHRLDKDTSGLLVVARHEKAQTHLIRQLQDRSVSREYVALVHGNIVKSGTVDRAIGRDARVPVRMAVENPIAPKAAITHYEPVRIGETAEGSLVTEVACRLETGRTHQIRVHMASLRHPLVADVLYGGKQLAGAARQLLHARALRFDDFSTGQRVSFEAPLAEDFLAVLQGIAWHEP